MSLTTPAIIRCMKCATSKGFNPYDSHSAFAKQASKALGR